MTRSLTYDVVVTDELLRSALPQMCEATRVLARTRQKQTQWMLVAIFCACAVAGVVVSVLLARTAGPTDRKFCVVLAVICLGVAIGLPIAFWIVDFAQQRNTWMQFPERFADRLHERSARRLVEQMIGRAPFSAHYAFSDHDVVTTIAIWNVKRRRRFDQVQMVIVGDRFLALALRRVFFFPLVFYFTESSEQHQQLESHLRAYKLQVTSLPPKFVPQAEKPPS